MPTLGLSNFNLVCSLLGGFIALFGLISFLAKERFYLSEALISLLAGALFGPGARWIRPDEYALGSEENLALINLYFTRLVLGVQLVIAGVQLPARYLWTERRSMGLLIGPGMVGMWLVTALLIFALVPDFPFLHALAVAACITPTDPVLSNSIVKGKFADRHLPKSLQHLVIAESGLNDGLGYPFLFLAMYLITYASGDAEQHEVGKAMGLWFYETWAYQILLSCVYGTVCGIMAKYLLRWAEQRRYVDQESFLVFVVALALFVIGTDGLIGSDDVLACFVAGNAFTWDDWFRQKTEDDTLQPSIDMLLNVAIFLWVGAVCPWRLFLHNEVIPIYRLIPLGILILLLRRPVIVAILHKYIYQIEHWRQMSIVGFFGPIGISAVFYLYVTLEYIGVHSRRSDGTQREDMVRLGEGMTVVVWFLVICSIIVHGLTIPLVKLGIHLPSTLSIAISMSKSEAPSPRQFSMSEAERANGNGNRNGVAPGTGIGTGVPLGNGTASSTATALGDGNGAALGGGNRVGPSSGVETGGLTVPRPSQIAISEPRRV